MNFQQIQMIRNISDSALIEIALKLAAHDLSLFESLHKGDTVKISLWDAPAYTITSEQLKAIRNVEVPAFSSGKISTIKYVRNMMGLGLKEAKDLVEELASLGYLDRSFARSADLNNEYRSACKVLS